MEFESIQTQRFLKAGQITRIFGADVSPPHDGWYEITGHADETVTLVELILGDAPESNRWAAFSDDELRELRIALDSEYPHPRDIDVRSVVSSGVWAELEARAALRTEPA